MSALPGIPGDVVAAYESLFFSVLSRSDELMFLRNIAYPNSRYVELSEKYLDETSLDVLLLRIGYNGGLENVLYAAGLQDDPTADMTAAEAAQLFNEAILSTGCMLASNGFLNHGKQHPVITATLELIKASKAMLPPGLDGDQEKGGPNMGEVCGKAMQSGSHGAN